MMAEMVKLRFEIAVHSISSTTFSIWEVITDRTPEWTEEQYLRNRSNTIMELVSDEETEEQTAVSREVKLG